MQPRGVVIKGLHDRAVPPGAIATKKDPPCVGGGHVSGVVPRVDGRELHRPNQVCIVLPGVGLFQSGPDRRRPWLRGLHRGGVEFEWLGTAMPERWPSKKSWDLLLVCQPPRGVTNWRGGAWVCNSSTRTWIQCGPQDGGDAQRSPGSSAFPPEFTLIDKKLIGWRR